METTKNTLTEHLFSKIFGDVRINKFSTLSYIGKIPFSNIFDAVDGNTIMATKFPIRIKGI